MKVILLDKIDNLGNVGKQVVVKSGYARNFLIPQSKAVPATIENIEKFKAQQLKLQITTNETLDKAKFCAEKINRLGNISITATSGTSGKLFGSVSARDIADAITKASNCEISKSQIRLPNHDVLKTTGTYIVNVHIYDEIFATLNVIVVSNTSI